MWRNPGELLSRKAEVKVVHISKKQKEMIIMYITLKDIHVKISEINTGALFEIKGNAMMQRYLYTVGKCLSFQNILAKRLRDEKYN